MILLDGPLGTELSRRGVATDLPRWSAQALWDAPDVVRAIHRDYANAGARVHTANTFRTKRRTLGESWERHARLAVAIARESIPPAHRVAGSIAPLEDCYRPDRSPADTSEHGELTAVLADAGCDLLLCETFPHVAEALVAVGYAVETGVETWVAFTAGPDGTLLSPGAMAEGARAAVDAGARAVLVNCTPARDTRRFLDALAAAKLGVPTGAYANGGLANDVDGFSASGDPTPSEYAALARGWASAGASIIGGCCGTGPLHIAALARAFADRSE